MIWLQRWSKLLQLINLQTGNRFQETYWIVSQSNCATWSQKPVGLLQQISDSMLRALMDLQSTTTTLMSATATTILSLMEKPHIRGASVVVYTILWQRSGCWAKNKEKRASRNLFPSKAASILQLSFFQLILTTKARETMSKEAAGNPVLSPFACTQLIDLSLPGLPEATLFFCMYWATARK
jgi:hypothetical protein